MGNVLVIEDDVILRDFFSQLVRDMGHKVISPPTYYEASKVLKSERIDVVILEGIPQQQISYAPWLKGESGEMSARSTIKLILPNILRNQAPPEIIIVTKAGFRVEARFAIENGALDYIQIPVEFKGNRKVDFHPERIKERISSQITFALGSLKQKKDVIKGIKRENIIGNSLQIRNCLEQIALAARNDDNVLITGETGTGKELAANATHINSKRARGPWVVLNCAAIPETLAESELFGIEGGIVTGVPKTQIGKIEFANGGTLFLDEVGDLSLSIQSKLLRAIENRSFYRVGGKTEIPSDFRLISATNRDLNEKVGKGEFRDDLLYRLETLVINSPPLRERREDIRELAEYHLNIACRRNGLDIKDLSPDFMDAISEYDWPGNVRELFNALSSAISLGHNDKTLLVNHLPEHIRIQWAQSAFDRESAEYMGIDHIPEVFHVLNDRGVHLSEQELQEAIRRDEASIENNEHSKQNLAGTNLVMNDLKGSTLPTWNDYLSKTQKVYLEQLMIRSGYNVRRASEISGYSESHLYKLLRESDVPIKPQPLL